MANLKEDTTQFKDTLGGDTLTKMKNRFKYQWKFSDFAFSFIAPCMKLCKKEENKRLTFMKRHGLYEKGEEKFVKEFDAINFARSMRVLRTLVSSMMDDSERVLTVYQKNHSIPVISEDSSSHSERDYDEVPELYTNQLRKNDHIEKVNRFMVSLSRFIY